MPHGVLQTCFFAFLTSLLRVGKSQYGDKKNFTKFFLYYIYFFGWGNHEVRRQKSPRLMVYEVFIKVPERLFLFSYSAVTIRFARGKFSPSSVAEQFWSTIEGEILPPWLSPGLRCTKKGFASPVTCLLSCSQVQYVKCNLKHFA